MTAQALIDVTSSRWELPWFGPRGLFSDGAWCVLQKLAVKADIVYWIFGWYLKGHYL